MRFNSVVVIQVLYIDERIKSSLRKPMPGGLPPIEINGKTEKTTRHRKSKTDYNIYSVRKNTSVYL